MILRLFALLVLIAISNTVLAAPTVEEIIKGAINKLEQDKKICSKVRYTALKKGIKYDKEMKPDGVTTTVKSVYQINERISEHILSMDKDGKPMTAKEIQKHIDEQNKNWLDEQKKGEKKSASRENYVDPLTIEGMPTYSYHLVETRDSAFDVVAAAVAGTKEIIDQSINRLTTYYVVQARAIKADEKHLNATYWIDANTYGLIRSEFEPSDMPRFVDHIGFKMGYLAVRSGDNLLYFPAKFEMTGKAGFLFMKGRFGVIEEYSGYQCDEAIDEADVAQRYMYTPEENQGE